MHTYASHLTHTQGARAWFERESKLIIDYSKLDDLIYVSKCSSDYKLSISVRAMLEELTHWEMALWLAESTAQS